MKIGDKKTTENGRSSTGAVHSSTGAKKSRKSKGNANGGRSSDRPGSWPTVKGWPVVPNWPVPDWPVVDWEPADEGGKDTTRQSRKQR